MPDPTAEQPGKQPSTASEEVSVPVGSIRLGDSPRLNGEDRAHIARLAEADAELPPILVDRRTMKVIDGMHRLRAAALQGRATIKVVFFDGRPAEVFIRAVKENIAHGLPLSQADRHAAAARIMASHPHMSDRAIGEAAGLAAKTVARIRRSGGAASQSSTRVGKDGRARPLNGEDGRLRAAEVLAQYPDASLREVARTVGIAPATVMDVRNRLARGEPPVLSRDREGGASPRVPAQPGPRGHLPLRPGQARPLPAATVEKLLRDPSLRNNDYGRQLLHLLQTTAGGTDQLLQRSTLVPSHCAHIVAGVAQQYAEAWQDFAAELTERGRSAGH